MRVLIPPGRNAQVSPRPSAALKERNRNILSIRELGRREWHKHSGYSERAMVENTVYRYKTDIESTPLVGTMDLPKNQKSPQGAALMKRTEKYVALDVHHQ